MLTREKEILALPEQERNAKMASIYKEMVEASLQEGGGKCCENQGHCEHSAPPQQPSAQPGGPMSGTNVASNSGVMSDEEKLRFFQSLAADPK